MKKKQEAVKKRIQPGRDIIVVSPEYERWDGDYLPDPAENWRFTHYGSNYLGAMGSEDAYLNGDERHRPLRMGDGAAPPPSTHVVLLEGWRTFGATNPPRGTSVLYTRRHTQSGALRLYHYEGGIPRVYVDGRAHADKPLYGHDEVICTNNADLPDPHPDDVGWHWNSFDPGNNSVGWTGGYSGYWMYGTSTNQNYRSPWYEKWRDGWEIH